MKRWGRVDLGNSEKERVDLSWRNEKKYKKTKNHISRSKKKKKNLIWQIESMTIDRVEWRKLSYWESIADPKILGVKLCLFFIGKENFIKRKIEKVKNAPMGTQAVYWGNTKN